MAELGQEIRRLTSLAYPKAPSDVRETLAKEQFVDALVNSEMRLKIKQARPVDLNDAVRHAVELEAFYRAESKQLGLGVIQSATNCSQSNSPDWKEAFSTLQTSVDTMTKAMNKILEQQQSRSYNRPQAPRQEHRPPNGQQRGGGQRLKCFICQSDQHLKRDCPKRNSNAPEKKGQKPWEGKANVCGNYQAGLFIPAKLGDYVVDCLIDTGATLTLVSTKVWDTIKDTKPLDNFDSNIVSASGNKLNTMGKTRVCFDINDTNYAIDAVIAEMDVDVILGLDFMIAHSVKVDVEGLIINLNGKPCSVTRAGKIGCNRVVVSEQVVVPGRSEIILPGRMEDWNGQLDQIGVLEPTESFVTSSSGMVARTLVKAGEQVPVRCANFSNEPKILYPGTNIANFSPVQVVREAETQKPIPSQNLPKHLTELYERSSAGMSSAQKKQIANLLRKYDNTFSSADSDLGRTGIIKHRIPTGDASPIKQPMRRVPVHMQEEVNKQLDTMLENNIIQPSKSPWASGIVLVKKKDGTKRFCIDYRRLNDVTMKDAYPLPRIDESLDQLSGSKWFSCLDLSAGYWQVEVDPEDKQKTAFSTRRGLFEYNVMPFGLCNAPATFERLMETVLSGLHWQICLIYLDDIIIFGKTFGDMINNLEMVLQRFEMAGLKLRPQKCQLFQKEVEFLGHIINESGVNTDPKKIECIAEWPIPRNVREVRSFLGLCGYYRRFIANYSHIAKPLTRLTEKDYKFNWTEECSEAFNSLKQMLITAPILAHPDFSKPFILDTDASDQAIGAVLAQRFDNKERVVAYASRTLTKTERKYCVTRKELLALVFFVKYFRHYLYGSDFTVRTDHSSLRWLMNFKNPEGQVARWLEILSTYTFTVEHRPGRLHGNADSLSRKPDSQSHKAVEDEDACIVGTTDRSCLQLRITETEDDDRDLIKLQREDEDLARVRTWVENKERPCSKDIAASSFMMKSLWNQFQRLEIQNGLLVRKLENFETDSVSYQAIVPRDTRRDILKYCHDLKTAGHLGGKKTLSKIRQMFYWPGLQSDVRSYIAGCETCTKRKEPNPTKRAPMQIVRSGYPMERLAIDILGELPLTHNGNKYILVISDYFTKWTEALPMPNMEACTVAKILVENVLCRFGIPQKIHSDQGRQFESNLFQEMCKILGIEKTRTTPYHPESDGMVERFNRTLAAMLSAYVSDNHRDWDEQLPYVMMAYRSAEHETTGMSPNMLMFGREVSTPLDLMFEMPLMIKPIPNNQWVWELQDRIESAHATVRKNTQQSMHRQKQLHDSRMSYEKFNIGDQVFVYFPVKPIGTSSKLSSFWRGPYKITGILSHVLYKVNCGRNGSVQVIHCNRIRAHKGQILRDENIAVPCELNHEANIDDDQSDQKATEGVVNPPKSDNEAEIDMTENEVEESNVGSRRQRKKPAWAKDYVFSCRNTMAKTKTTPRAQAPSTSKAQTVPIAAPLPICPVCKETVGKSENFEKHLVECYKGRPQCSTCGQMFKLRSYLIKHEQSVHGVPSEKSVVKEASKVKAKERKESAKALSDSSDNSDWEDEPDVSLGVSDSEDEKVKSDSLSKDLVEGRIIRKATTPALPVAPKRKMTEVKKDAVEKAVKLTESGKVKDMTAFNVLCKQEKKDNSSESVTKVTENGEEIYANSVVRKRQKVDNVNINLGDLIPEGSVRISDIQLQLIGEGNVELKLSYRTEDDD